VNTLAITDNDYVLLQKSVLRGGSHLYALDRVQGTWQPLKFPAEGFQDTSYFLLGATGNTLAFWTKGSGFTPQLAAVR
jgi:hypothetical protein